MNELELFDRSRFQEFVDASRIRFLYYLLEDLEGRPSAFCVCMDPVAGMACHSSPGQDTI